MKTAITLLSLIFAILLGTSLIPESSRLAIPDQKTHILVDSLRDGKALFVLHCSPCHSETKTLIGPPFQRIRDDYGLEWTLSFIRNSQQMIDSNDVRAKYSYVLNYKIIMVSFNSLTDKEIIAILDYADSHKFDFKKYLHRKLPEAEMKKIIDEYY